MKHVACALRCASDRSTFAIDHKHVERDRLPLKDVKRRLSRACGNRIAERNALRLGKVKCFQSGVRLRNALRESIVRAVSYRERRELAEIERTARGVQIQRALREFCRLGETAGYRYARNGLAAQIRQHAACKIAHLDERAFR